MLEVSLSKELTYKGQTYQFVDTVPTYLICSVCLGVLVEPHITGCCAQHYCDDCLDKGSWYHQPVCLFCRMPNFRHWLDLQAESKVKALQVYCRNRKDGCKWTGAISQIDVHLSSSCSYSFTTCDCKERIKVQELGKHLLRGCPVRRHHCKHCGLGGTYRFITGPHLRECPQFKANPEPQDDLDPLVECPNLCNPNPPIKQSDLEEHLKTCPMEQVNCMYGVVGCTARTLRVDQELHLRTHMEKHSYMLLESVQQSMRAVMMETEVLATLPIHMQNIRMLSVECIKTLAGSISTELEENSPPLTFRMNNFTGLKESGSYWRSMEFSIGGCKMRLVVAPNGIAEGTETHLSVILEAVRFNVQSYWSKGVFGVELKPQCEGKVFVGSFWLVDAQQIPWKDMEEWDGLPASLSTCPLFVTHEDLHCGMLLNDSLVFQVKKVED